MIATQEHRGHPTHAEEARASYTRERTGACIVVLQEVGFSHDEAVAFIAGVAWEIGFEKADTWHSPDTALKTLSGLMAGRGAKHWSLDLIDMAVTEIGRLR